MTVRSHLAFLKEWIDEKLADITSGKTPNPEKTFAYYWIKNAGDGENFAHKDVVFEVFHNFVALSQWGNTMYNIMLKLAKDTGDPEARAWFKKTMEGRSRRRRRQRLYAARALRDGVVPHHRRRTAAASPLCRGEDAAFRAARLYRHAAHVDELRSGALERSEDVRSRPLQQRADQPPDRRGQVRRRLASPNARSTARPSTLRTAARPRSTIAASAPSIGIVDGKPLPVCDYAGFAPFGFGYRRCPGEQLTIQVFEDFLRKVWKSKIEFQKLDIANPEPLPIGPTTVIGDNVGFTRAA